MSRYMVIILLRNHINDFLYRHERSEESRLSLCPLKFQINCSFIYLNHAYSYLNVSMGFTRAATRAGNQAENSPTSVINAITTV